MCSVTEHFLLCSKWQTSQDQPVVTVEDLDVDVGVAAEGDVGVVEGGAEGNQKTKR